MQIHQLQKPNGQKTRKRIGRGGKRGTYSGKGIKGQNSRSGSSKRLAILDFIGRIPKLQGVPAKRYKKQGVRQFRKVYQIVNLDVLDKNFKEGEVVSPKTLMEKKIVRKMGRGMLNIKILGNGQLKKKLSFKGVAFSENVKVQISNVKSSSKSK